MIFNVSFKGIVPPYTNAQGYYITPISKNPQKSDIEAAIQATKTDDSHSGLNGKAYFYGEDLVVKKYKKPEEVKFYNPYREIRALDSMYDKGILSPNIQRGEFAFTTPNDETYLVSTKVSGSNANPIHNKFNRDNIRELLKALYSLDLPHKYQTDSDVKFPYVVPMHYDISMGNYNITNENAGIFDFEYLQYEDLNKPFTQMNYQYMPDTLPDLSDISGIVSNLRNFEYRGLLPYLMKLDSNEALQIFKDYLSAKSQYHLQRARMFSEEGISLENENPSLAKELFSLSTKEYTHHFCLSNLTPNIIKAEAMKIQIASFIYLQSPFSRSIEDKINPLEIREYILKANNFFDKQIINSTGDKKMYYQDCKDLMKSWNNLFGWMDYQEIEPKLENYMTYNREFSEHDNVGLEKIHDRYKNHLEMYKLYQSKVTKDHIATLDEHLKL